MKETPVQQRVRIEAGRLNVLLWRNNNGACYDATGRLIRYGLGNDSKQANDEMKSSDLIGITPKIVTPDMVGSIVAIFTAVETKASDWRFSPNDEHTRAQKRYIDLVRQYGGYADFATDPAQLMRIVGLT